MILKLLCLCDFDEIICENMNGIVYRYIHFSDRDIKVTPENSVAPQNSSKIKLQIFQHSFKDLEHGNVGNKNKKKK